MVYCPIFRISGSIIKPSRETLLDYCSYCLIVIALIGAARIWIGGSGMTQDCPLNNASRSDAFVKNNLSNRSEESNVGVISDVQNKSSIPISDDLVSLYESMMAEGSSQIKMDGEKVDAEEPSVKCAKYYQSVFAYILLVESSILLFSGLIWTKIPRVSQSIDKFSKVLNACGKSSWSKKALSIISSRGPNGDVSQSLHSIISSESPTHNVRSFLDHLFHPDNDYKSKSNARHLYEKVVIFCEQYSQSTTVWSTYIVKSLVQFLLWLIIFNINLVLFVILEFYIVCPEDNLKFCDHDTFLRIIWFMGQTVLLIYAVFNCKTLMWINEKSVVKRNLCCCCRCFSNYRMSYADDYVQQRMTCKPYRFADNPHVYNDAALLLHLLEEAHPKRIPPFVVFMFPEWKEKLTSFSTPAIASDVSSVSTMQMISGRPSVTVSIIDIATPSEKQRKRNPSGKRKAQVTFSVSDEEQTNTDNFQRKNLDNWSTTPTRPKEFVQQPSVELHFVDKESCSADDKTGLLHESSSSENIEHYVSHQDDSNHESDVSETGLLIKNA